jgi:hypothetical protein
LGVTDKVHVDREYMLILDVMGAALTEEFGGTVSVLDQIKPVPEDPITKPKRENHLNFHVKVAEDQRVTLSDGTRLETLKGHVTIYPRIEDIEDSAKGIGIMSYSDAVAEESIPASYWIRVRVPQAQFDELLSAARVGRAPSCIMVSERGTTLPDEFTMKWDEKASPHLHIASINFSVPLVALVDRDVDRAAKPSELHALTEVMHSINTKIRWLTVLVAMVAAIALLHAFR